MTVKVVQGLIGNLKPTQPADINTATQAAIRAAQSPASVTNALQQHSTEAVSVSVKGLKSASGVDRIRDSKEAKETADKVADKIRENPESAEAHNGLSSAAGRAHLSAS